MHYMQEIARSAIAAHPSNVSAVVASVVLQLQQTYPGHIFDEPQWMFNNAGGAMGSMYAGRCVMILAVAGRHLCCAW